MISPETRSGTIAYRRTSYSRRLTESPKKLKGVGVLRYEAGQKVVYPNYGVTLVKLVDTTRFDGQDTEIYRLHVYLNEAEIMVPVENGDLVGLRPLGTVEEIDTMMSSLEDGNILTYKDWKSRYKQNTDKMRTGELETVSEVLKNLSMIAAKKTLSFREKKMYERARYFVISEIAHVRDISLEEAEQVMDQALEAGLMKRNKDKQIAS